METDLTFEFTIEFRLIIAFKVEELKEGDEFKASWKEVEKSVKGKFPLLKLIYARGDDRSGHLAFSNLRLKTDLIDQLVKDGMTIQEKSFSFDKLKDEPLKEFWTE